LKEPLLAMSVITCYIVDDEPVSRAILQYYISQLSWLHLQGEFEDAKTAAAAFQKHPVDLLFLDINMKGMSGIALAEALSPRPLIVFTTASREYGPEAFALEATDYLVKPITQERFLQAAEKIKRTCEQEKPAAGSEDDACIFVRDHKALVKLSIADILYVEALGDYLKLHTGNRFFTMLGTMKQMEEKLKAYGFMRIHRSYMVALRAVSGVEAGNIIIGQQRLPVSDTYRAELFAEINQKKL
jgi:DNA-binding LytR/AlgR family response regulator